MFVGGATRSDYCSQVIRCTVTVLSVIRVGGAYPLCPKGVGAKNCRCDKIAPALFDNKKNRAGSALLQESDVEDFVWKTRCGGAIRGEGSIIKVS